jgi:hypothetical protein
VRRDQTAAIGRAVRALSDDRGLWLVDSGALAFPVTCRACPPSSRSFFRYRGVVAKVALQWWADREWLRSVTLALP